MNINELVVGIDLGTQGVRAMAVSASGEIAAQAQVQLPAVKSDMPAGWHQQDPLSWRDAMMECLRALTSMLPASAAIAGVTIDSTSGTVLPVDARGEALHPALMYNDQRSEGHVEAVRQAGAALETRLGYAFASSFALPKLLWFRLERPEIYQRTACFLHAADYLAGCLNGVFNQSDTSNALKTGYDLIDLRWPEFIEAELGIDRSKLPVVFLPGERMGEVTGPAGEICGLPFGTPVFAGATDGTAAQLASGAVELGDWNSTLGTTLIFKGISRHLTPDPHGRVYFHRHPDGGWMPGGASNTGTEWLQKDHPGADIDALNLAVKTRLPSRLVRYPLARRGERFPFVVPEAEGFILGEGDNLDCYAAGLEGIALVERLAYDLMARVGLDVGERVYISGGGTRSRLWSQLRATILEKTLIQPVVSETAMGAALLAACGCWYGSVGRAAREMVREASRFEPERSLAESYTEKYGLFCAELRLRGYLRG